MEDGARAGTVITTPECAPWICASVCARRSYEEAPRERRTEKGPSLFFLLFFFLSFYHCPSCCYSYDVFQTPALGCMRRLVQNEEEAKAAGNASQCPLGQVVCLCAWRPVVNRLGGPGGRIQPGPSGKVEVASLVGFFFFLCLSFCSHGAAANVSWRCPAYGTPARTNVPICSKGAS